MNFEETSAYRARAAHCAHQAGLTQDTILKKFWDDSAEEWLALDSTLPAVGRARTGPSFASRKYSDHA